LLKKSFYVLFVFLVLMTFSCGKNQTAENKSDAKKDNTKFEWAENISINDIPEFPVKGFFNGTEVSFKYICFIKWRGSNDNEIQFSTNKPQSSCGAVVNDTAFIFTSLKKDLTKGEVLKENFTITFDSYASYILINVGEDSRKINAPWNAAIRIDDIGEKTVKGKIAICFKDEKKSWVAGKFEAILCNN
jgi:hypothetical protein